MQQMWRCRGVQVTQTQHAAGMQQCCLSCVGSTMCARLTACPTCSLDADMKCSATCWCLVHAAMLPIGTAAAASMVACYTHQQMSDKGYMPSFLLGLIKLYCG
jgi:hypothetical protein